MDEKKFSKQLLKKMTRVSDIAGILRSGRKHTLGRTKRDVLKGLLKLRNPGIAPGCSTNLCEQYCFA